MEFEDGAKASKDLELDREYEELDLDKVLKTVDIDVKAVGGQNQLGTGDLSR